ncbi:sigma-70 family RNA polymerase sigma factor [Rhizocola hellebori]|uniref:sigma-70 family RNA polymerase sigma factor n=1 Tax=Rhizocola hellebori TaxID=1392758 RepID=UPI004032FC2C
MVSRGQDGELVTAARVGDEAAFAELVKRYREELRVHCYRMLGSFEESEDLVQETFLRAWKKLAGFEGRSSFRTWLYRIATNACLDALDGQARRMLPQHAAGPSQPGAPLRAPTDIAWLQPYPDTQWEPAAPSDDEPDAAVVSRETIELAFLAAIQHLPPRQRATLILRDVLGWPADQTAVVLETSVASANSALQRARATLRSVLPSRRQQWAPTMRPTTEEKEILRRYMKAITSGDLHAVAALLAEDVRTGMPPFANWYSGRDAVLAALAAGFDTDRFHLVPVGANRQPALASYLRDPDTLVYNAFAIGLFTIEQGVITEITSFHLPSLFASFALPDRVLAHDR